MLSISHPMKGADVAVAYYLDERKEDYYLNGLDKKGRWFGGAAEGFGLLGHTVERRTFHNLLNGLSPDGRQALVQNAGNPDRQTCWDMTFNAPKPVSAFWGTSPPDIRRQIEQDLQESVQATLGKAQEIGGITRSGAGGKIKEPAGLIWAMFPEGTSRAQDPHLHLHAVLINLGRRAGGTIGSIYTLNMFRWKMALGSIFQAELASRLGQRFGLHIEPEKIGFGIREVPKALCRTFSKRRQTIERTMNERGVSGALEAKTVAKETRPKKEEIPPERLFPHWRNIGQSFGWSPEQAIHLDRTGLARPLTAEQLAQRVRHVVQEMPAEKQTRSQLVRTAARVSFEQGADGHALFQSLTKLRTSDGRQVLWQPRWPDRTMSQQENRHEATQLQTTPPPGANVHSQRGPQSVPHPEHGNSPPREPTSSASQTDGAQPQSKNSQHPVEPASLRWDEQKQHPELPPLWAEEHGRTTDEARQTTTNGHGSRAQKKSSAKARPQSRTKNPAHSAEKARRQRLVLIRACWKALYAKRPWLPEQERFVHTHWQPVFERAWWKHAQKLCLPSIGIELPRLAFGAAKPFVPRWKSIHWKKDFKLFELRVQDRILCRSAPKWSPIHGLAFPALRFTLSKSESPDMKRSHPINPPDPTKEKSKDHGHSH